MKYHRERKNLLVSSGPPSTPVLPGVQNPGCKDDQNAILAITGVNGVNCQNILSKPECQVFKILVVQMILPAVEM